MKKRRAAELMAGLHPPPTPPTSDQESDGDFERTPGLSREEDDKMLAKVWIEPFSISSKRDLF